jgi:Raf kinase inhibitor-like YbhB/YbcL family protein
MVLLILLCSLLVQTSELTITSPDFSHEGELPSRFTCDGDNANPTLNVHGIPEGTKSLAIIVEDPDVTSTTFSHWIVWNIPPQETIAENTTPGVQGNNSMGKNNYLGPCPMGGMHRYFFKVFALNTMLDIDANSNKKKLEDAMGEHILARGEIMGWYRKK